MRRWLATSGLALVTAWMTEVAPGAAQVAAEGSFESVRETARHYVESGELPSVAIAVARGGRIVWEEAFGWADRERQVEATPHTPYSIASITKPITATAVMLLAERGALALDRPINEYLGHGRLTGLGGDAAQATVSRVLSHTAGLPLHYQFFYEDEPERPPPMDETIARWGIVVHPPGEAYDYSNLGYGILEHVISRVSGSSYEEFLRAELFEPLGMRRSAVGVPSWLRPYVAARYDSAGTRIPAYDFDHRGGSAVYASAHDLARFALFHMGALADAPEILADSTLARMRLVMTPGAEGSGYGLGWTVRDEEGGRLSIGHTGGMPGVRTVLSLYPEVGVAVVVLTNTSGYAVFDLAREVAAAALPGYSEALADEARARAARRAGSVGSIRGEGISPVEAQPLPIGAWAGELRTWEGSRAFRLVVDGRGGVRIRSGRDAAVTLGAVRWHDGWLSGIAPGTFDTSAARGGGSALLLRLRLRDGVLSGPVTAHSTDHPIRYALTSWVRLTREDAGGL